MSSSSKVASYNDVLKRVREMQSKSAASQGDKVSDVKDPTNAGTVTPPTHPAEATTNAALPGGNPMSDNTSAPKSIESKQAVGTLEGATPATTDGNAKDRAVDSPTAKLASNVAETVSRIKGLLKTAGKDSKEQPTESKAEASDPTEKGKVEPSKKNGPEDLPAAATPATAPANGEGKSAAANEAFELPADAYVKLAHALVESEEGLILAANIIKEAKGAQVAEQLIQNALRAQEEFHKAASAEAQGAAFVEELFKSASAEERTAMVKYAQVHNAEIANIDARQDLNDEEKQLCKVAYSTGAMDGAAMTDSPTGDLPGGASPEATPEDIIAVIEQLVAAGQIPQEVAAQLVAELTGGAGGEAPAGEAPAGEGAAEEAAETEEEKQAAAKDPALALTGAHRKSASADDKLAAEILRASLPAA